MQDFQAYATQRSGPRRHAEVLPTPHNNLVGMLRSEGRNHLSPFGPQAYAGFHILLWFLFKKLWISDMVPSLWMVYFIGLAMETIFMCQDQSCCAGCWGQELISLCLFAFYCLSGPNMHWFIPQRGNQSCVLFVALLKREILECVCFCFVQDKSFSFWMDLQ